MNYRFLPSAIGSVLALSAYASSAPRTFCNPIPAENMPIGVVCWHFNDGDRITPTTPNGCHRWWYTTTNGVATARQYREMADPETHVWNGAWYLYSSCGLLWKSTDAGGTWSRIPAMDHDPDYAPTVERFRGKYYLTECFSSLKVADSPEGPFRELGKFDIKTFQSDPKQRIRLGDPQLFADGDHLYLYWGLCEEDIWGAELDPENPTKALKPAVKLCSMSPARPWMRHPFEGAFVFKRGADYYLLHSGNEAATQSYCMSVWRSKSPLGPYAPQAENPFFFATKPGMVYGGGHGSVWQDERGDFWINYTICPQGKGFHGFQRYIGQDRLEFAPNGDIRIGHPTDEPQWLPSSGKKGPTGWKKLPLTTTAEKSVDDEPYTYETLGDLPSTTVFELGRTCEINAFRLFWMDLGLDVHRGVPGGPYRYRVERRLKGEWTTWFDASANDRDLTADYRETPSATADAVRLVVVGAPKGLKPGLGEFTVFGRPLGTDETVTRRGLSVTYRSCSKCPARLRFENDGRRAYVNLARLADDGTDDKDVLAARKEELTERAFRLMERVSDVGAEKKTRPLMGWSSWNTFGPKISEMLILDMARAMKTNGLAAAGYTYVNIDDGFQCRRNPRSGRLGINPDRFPRGLKPVVEGVHALGLKAGIYSDGGADTCCYQWNNELQEEGTGFFGHDDQDCALFFTELGFDFIKVDYCGGQKIQLDERKRYTEIARAIRRTGCDVRFNVCRWAYPGTWVADIAESWRTTGDIRAQWPSVRNLFVRNLFLHPYASPGHYNDMDMLEVGHRLGKTKTDFGHGDPGLTESQEVVHFGLWSIMSSPLLIGCDARKLPPETMELVTNPYVLAMNQNDLGVQARLVRNEGERYILVKDADERYGTARFLALANFLNDKSVTFRVPLKDLELGGKVAMMDLVARTDIGVAEGEIVLEVPAQSAKFLRLDAEERLFRSVYEAEDGFCSDYQNLVPAAQAKTPEVVAENWQDGIFVKGLGGRPSNDLVWRDVNIPAAGTYELSVEARTNGTFFVQVDGARPRPGEKPLKVLLGRGLHEVRLVNARDAMPDVNRLRVREVR